MRDIIIPESDFVILGGSSRGYAKKAPVGGVWYKLSAGAFNAQYDAYEICRNTNGIMTDAPHRIEWRDD